jgi:two-component system, sensor histidine kinase PdtaS
LTSPVIPDPADPSITREQLAAALSRSLNHQSALAEFGALSLSGLDHRKLLQDATEVISRATGCRFVKVLQYRKNSDDFLVSAGVGWKPGVVGHAVLPSGMRSPCGRAFLMAQPIHVEDVSRDPTMDWSPLLREHGLHSVINVPIRFESSMFGVLEIDDPQPKEFSQNTVNFLMGFASILGAAIRRSELENQQNTLFQEFQHRIKNNFQMVLALLQYEQPAGNEEQIIRRVRDRIRAIGFATEQLSGKNRVDQVDLRSYLGELCRNLAEGADPIKVRTDLQHLMVPYEKAVPLGLIVNELVTNSLKHAFGDNKGAVEVILHKIDGAAELSVADDGKGIDPASRGEGKGFKLVSALSKQIDASIQHVPVDKGTCYRLQFPLIALADH